MKKTVIVFFLLIFSANALPQIPVLSFDQLEPRLSTESDSLYIVNFWATWCVPCVKELPELEKINKLYAGENVKVLLVSLDNPDHMESRLIPFTEKHNIESEVVLLDDPRSNRWIPKVDSSWTGSIPATVFFTKDSKYFHEGSLTFDELEEIVRSKLNY